MAHRSMICCLVDDGKRCDKLATAASFSKKIQKQISQRKLNLEICQGVSHTYICEYHKSTIQSIRSVPSYSPSMGHSSAYDSFQGVTMKRKKGHKDHLEERETVGSPLPTGYNQNGMGMWGSDVSAIDLSLGRHHPGERSNVHHHYHPRVIKEGDIDLSQLQVNTLRRYKRYYRIPARPGINKAQLAEILQGHFTQLPVIEKEAITYFIYMVKTNKNKLDHGGGKAEKMGD